MLPSQHAPRGLAQADLHEESPDGSSASFGTSDTIRPYLLRRKWWLRTPRSYPGQSSAPSGAIHAAVTSAVPWRYRPSPWQPQKLYSYGLSSFLASLPILKSTVRRRRDLPIVQILTRVRFGASSERGLYALHRRYLPVSGIQVEPCAAIVVRSSPLIGGTSASTVPCSMRNSVASSCVMASTSWCRVDGDEQDSLPTSVPFVPRLLPPPA